jgi:hypothetical protein
MGIRSLMSLEKTEKFIPNGLWVPLPVAAIKYLAKNHRPADRVLYALCLHLGQGLVAVFPSYPTVAMYSSVGKKQLRAQFNKLIELGFISIEKKRQGKTEQNFYTILPKAWTFRDGPSKGKSGPSLDHTKRWMCNSCEKIVPVELTQYVRSVDWEGNNNDHWIHSVCQDVYGSRKIQQIPWYLMDEEELLRFRRERNL